MRAVVLFLASAAAALAQMPARPFPQHAQLAAGVKKPSIPQAAMDATVAAAYDTWKARYLHAGCEAGQSYIFYNREKRADRKEAISCSEGHGYGMLFTALMAGHDMEAHRVFDELFAFFRAHQSHLTPGLMAWQQVTGCKNAKDGDDSASDGDLDIAYALLLADAQWGSTGAIDYAAEAKRTIAAIAKGEVNAANPSLALGDWVFAGGKKNLHDTRLSDFMPGHLRAFHRATGEALWLRLLDRHYTAVDFLQTKFAPATGLVPDFARGLDTATPQPAGAKFLEGRWDGHYYYNSCRVPLRLGADFALTGEPRAKAALDRMNGFIVAKTGGKPAAIRPGYTLEGKPIQSDYTAMAFTAPFAVAAMAGADQAWLDAMWKYVAAGKSDEDDYFSGAIRLLSLLVASGNWWAP